MNILTFILTFLLFVYPQHSKQTDAVSCNIRWLAGRWLALAGLELRTLLDTVPSSQFHGLVTLSLAVTSCHFPSPSSSLTSSTRSCTPNPYHTHHIIQPHSRTRRHCLHLPRHLSSPCATRLAWAFITSRSLLSPCNSLLHPHSFVVHLLSPQQLRDSSGCSSRSPPSC